MCEFTDKGWNVKGLNKLVTKLRDPGSMTRRTRTGRRRSVRSDASLVFTRYSRNMTCYKLGVYTCLFQISWDMSLVEICIIV